MKLKVFLTITPNSPLEQFAILPLVPMNIGHLYFSFTNPSLFMLLTLSLVLLLVHFVTKNGGGNSVPNAWQSLVELIYDFVPNLVNEQIGGLSGNVKQKFFPRISVTFTFSLFRNPQGMIPYSFTVTSHFLITLGLSFSIFIGITIVGFQRNGLHFLSFLLPAGVPLPLAPFLVLLELIPYCFRALSSGIRLFANMMAGHSSVKILSGFAWTMLCMNDLFYFIGNLGPLFIVLALTGPELGVAISQAHVSTISICIYLNDATNLHQSEVVIYNWTKARSEGRNSHYFHSFLNKRDRPWSATSPLAIWFGNGPSFGTCGLVTDTGASPSRSKFHVSLDSNSQTLLFVSSICSFSCRGMWSKDSHKDRTECLLLGKFLATLISIRYFHDHCGRISFLARYQV